MVRRRPISNASNPAGPDASNPADPTDLTDYGKLIYSIPTIRMHLLNMVRVSSLPSSTLTTSMVRDLDDCLDLLWELQLVHKQERIPAPIAFCAIAVMNTWRNGLTRTPNRWTFPSRELRRRLHVHVNTFRRRHAWRPWRLDGSGIY